jgi:hypothetical protein
MRNQGKFGDALRARLRDAAEAEGETLADRLVPGQRHGYTVEFSSLPERHREEYDEAEARILAVPR